MGARHQVQGAGFSRSVDDLGNRGRNTYGLPLEEVERVLALSQIDPAWLQHHDGAPLRIAEQIRRERAFADLPILADALEEGGCTLADVLEHCRAAAPHQQTCWVLELLLGQSGETREDRRRLTRTARA